LIRLERSHSDRSNPIEACSERMGEGVHRKTARARGGTRNLWSNENKPERERMIVRAFLRCIGVAFTDDEIRSSHRDPPDVVFREAQFEVMEDLGGRKRGDECRKRQRKWAQAERLSDLAEPYTPSEPMPMAEAFPRSVDALAKKATHYGSGVCAQLDALLYLDLAGQHLWPLEQPLDREAAAKATAQGWRSVSLLFPPYGAAIHTRSCAPGFLKDAAGEALAQWPRPGAEGLFDP
jgi:hypothetical protein